MNSEEKEMSFLDHLEELRWHVVRSLGAVMVCMIVAFVFSKTIFDTIVFAPARPDFLTFRWLCNIGHYLGRGDSLCITEIPMKIQSRMMTGQFTMALTSSFVLGIVIAFPYVAWEFWRFVKPGLHSNERKYSKGAVASISTLFFIGISFGYYILCPVSVYFLSTYSISDIISNEFDIISYVSTVTTLVFGSGLLFQLPVVVYFLSQIGIVTPALLKQYRKHAIVLVLLIAAILTPPDPISQVVVSFPLFMLYEFSIFVSSVVVRRKAREEAEELEKDRQALEKRDS
jgi:sec-independent protein translocase protein TatC